MKREILFRGKTKAKDSKWIYGDLNNVFDGVYIFNRNDESELNSPDNYEVNPETVGQFTGLTDINGVKVFEDDLVQWTRMERNGIESSTHKCYFDTETLQFGLKKADELFNCQFSEEFKVIGNIHDK